MPSLKAGGRFLTATGAPVQILEAREDTIVLQGLGSDNRFVVPFGYPLRPFDSQQAVWETRPRPYSPQAGMPEASKNSAKSKPLAPLIDAMLLAGDKTMRGIIREIRRKASGSCKGRDVPANIRARLYWLRKKGHRIKMNAREQISVIPSGSSLQN